MEKGFSIVTCHFSSQTVIYQWVKSDNRGDNRVTIGKACERIVTFWGTDYRRYSRGVHGKVAAERKEETPKVY